jgi:hypothetical protein
MQHVAKGVGKNDAAGRTPVDGLFEKGFHPNVQGFSVFGLPLQGPGSVEVKDQRVRTKHVPHGKRIQSKVRSHQVRLVFEKHPP